jgi:UDP-4-amino-4,6-dideoxy-N-acetyl-beta-L-altrosamine transaminase
MQAQRAGGDGWMIPYGRQSIDASDEAAVLAALRSDFLTQGPAVPRFETALRHATGARHALAMNSATSALHVACLALGLGPGKLLWTTPNTFVASANCGRLCGADVDFVDMDPLTLNLCPDALARKLQEADRAGRRPDVVIPVDFAGLPADMRAIRTLADRWGFRIIEDASHAIGASDGGIATGAGRAADITVLSFHPVKIVTTAEGGAALTDHDDLAQAMERTRTHGITRDPSQMRGESEGPWYYQQVGLGLNYRMTDLQAALGESQMHRLRDFVRARTQLADRYDSLLAGLPVTPAPRRPGALSAWHLYVIQLDTALEPRRRQIFERMRAAGIGVNVHYIPVHLQPYYRDLGFREGDFPNAERYYRRAITLPLHPGLTHAQQDLVVAALREAIA